MARPVDHNKNTNNFLRQHFRTTIQNHSASQNKIIDYQITEMKKSACFFILVIRSYRVILLDLYMSITCSLPNCR